MEATMRIPIAFLAAWLAAALPAVQPWPAAAAAAQPIGPCLDRKDLMSHLASEYGESPVARGLASAGAVIELVVSPGGDTWTIIATLPNGLSCGFAAGEAWQAVPSAVRTDPPA